MFVLPKYIDYHEKDGAILITSQLRQNTVKLSDPSIVDEFRSILRCGGCTEISTPLQQFLHEQELLINEEEISQSIAELKNALNEVLILTLMPTEGCNFRCSYCYEDHAPTSMRRETLDQIQNYIAERAPEFRHVCIAWFGGEPTLCKDTILETCELVQTLQRRSHYTYSSRMTTNGYLLCLEDFQKYYRAGISSYQITLDGWTHDQTRPHITGKGTLQKILGNLIAISRLPKEDYQFHITLRHNILPGDEDYSWYDHLNTLLGKDSRFSVLVRPVCDWGGDSVQSLEVLKGNAVNELLQKHVLYLEQIGMKCDNGKKGLLSRICYASYPHSLVFRASGKIEKCTICLDHPRNCVGYIDPEKGVVIDEKMNQLWCGGELKPECYHCKDVLSCMNLHCRKAVIVDGKTGSCCSSLLPDMY